MTGGDPGYPAKRMKTFMSPDMETILDPVIEMFITKIHVHFNHSAEVIFGVSGKHLLAEQQDLRRARISYKNLVRNGIHHEEVGLV